MEDTSKLAKTNNGKLKRKRVWILLCSILFAVFWGILVKVRPDLLALTSLAFFTLASLIFVYALLRSKSNILLALLSLSITLLLIEAVFSLREHLFVSKTNNIQYEWSPSPFVNHPTLTIWTKPSSKTRVSKMIKDEVIYENVLIEFDEYGRRECDSSNPQPSMHALFFGGSFTFGEGVASEDSLPCAFQQLSRGAYRSYNFGQQGYGTGQMYFILHDSELLEPEIPPQGIAVYSFIPDHIPRTVGEISKLTGQYSYNNYYLFELDSESRLKEPYKLSSRPMLNKILSIYRILRVISPAARYAAQIQLLILPADESIRVVAELIVESKRLYDSRYAGDFYVLLWPRNSLSPPLEQVLIDHLREAGVKILRNPELPIETPGQLHRLDSHPSAAEYELVAKNLYESVNNHRK